MDRQQKFSRILLYVIIITCVIPLLLPFFWLMLSSLKTYNRVYRYPPEWLPVVEKFFVDNNYMQEPFLVNIIDKNEDTGTGIFRIRILSLANGSDIPIPCDLIETEHYVGDFIELDGVEYEIQRFKKNRSDHQILVAIKNKHPQVTVSNDKIIPQTISKKTVYLFRQNIAVVMVEHHKKTAIIQIAEESKPFEISLQKLRVIDDNTGIIKVLSESVPVKIIEHNNLAKIARVKLIPSSKKLKIVNDRIHESQTTRFFLEEHGNRYPVKWVKRGRVSIVKRMDLSFTCFVSPTQIKTKEITSHFTKLYGQRVKLKIMTDKQNMKLVKVLDPISLDEKLVTVEKKFAPQWKNYVNVLKKEPFHYYLLNTVFITLCSILGQVLSCSLAGYAFARIRFPGRDLLFIILLSTLMLPYQVIMIPQFILYVKLGWLDTFKPLIVPTFLAQAAFFVFLFRQYFMTIPYELEDAARIDGCGPLYTYWHIILPLSKPVVVSVAIFTFMWTWNDFLYPLLYLNSDEHQTLALALENFKTAFGLRDPHFLMAASTMMVIPSIVIFFLAQKAFIRGVAMTGIKG